MEDGRDTSRTTGRPDDAVDAHASEQNRLLRAMAAEDYAWLLPKLTLEPLPMRRVLVEQNVPIADVWFPRQGIASIIASDQKGDGVEAGTVGFEGFVGLPILLEDHQLPNQVVVQVSGHGWRIAADDFRRALDERPALRTLCLRYASYYVAQVSQSVACNLLHGVDQRCARWLLMTHDRVHGASFELTQQFLSIMLGVRRAGVSEAMSELQRTGSIRYTRGHITVVDRSALEAVSCGCYQITRDALDRLLG